MINVITHKRKLWEVREGKVYFMLVGQLAFEQSLKALAGFGTVEGQRYSRGAKTQRHGGKITGDLQL